MRVRLREWIITILAFVAAFYTFALYSYFGIEDFVKDGELKQYFDSRIWHLEVWLGGILFGSLFVLVNQLAEKQFWRRKSYGFNILVRSALYLLSLVLVGIVIYYIFSSFNLIPSEQLQTYQSFSSTKLLLAVVIYYVTFVLFLNFVLYMRKKFGPGLLFDLLTGKYFHPKNEELIFLFLDLKSSTMLAEKLGHNTYSSLIKECVHELTPVIKKYRANVYQYVGDEVVLYWTKNDGFHKQRCIQAFFAFIDLLDRRKGYFNKKYGEIPTFKAGMDWGTVTMTEIGDIKREIAFHGDVLNTAARLEKKCNEFGAQMIVTEHIVDQLENEGPYFFKFLSDLPLRGKSENVKFYSVSQSRDSIQA